MFDVSHKRHDVALLLLDEWVAISYAVRPIQLPRQGQRVPIGKTCYMTGILPCCHDNRSGVSWTQAWDRYLNVSFSLKVGETQLLMASIPMYYNKQQ